MLTPADRARAAEAFSVYDQEWRYLARYLGEPHLIGDHFVFDDGRVLNVCAFGLGRPTTSLGPADLSSLLLNVWRETDHQLVHVWGPIDVPRRLELGGVSYKLTDDDALTDDFGGEFTLDLEGFDLAALPEARHAVRQLVAKRIEVRVAAHQGISGRHLDLVEAWKETHPIAPVGQAAAQAALAYLDQPGVDAAEAYVDGVLVGFSVFSTPSPTRAVNLMSFSRRRPGFKFEDALLWGTIEHLRAKDTRVLHLGYAGYESLSRFKRKWGAHQTGPSYRQAMFARSEAWAQRARSYDFYWTSRFFATPASSLA